MKIFYFTSTGNSLSIAKKFENAELISIPQILKSTQLYFEDSEKIGIVFPTYGVSMPTIVKEFITKVSLKSPYIFVIATCGGNSGGAIDNFIKIANNKNIKIDYYNTIVMPDNYLTFFDMAKNSEPNYTTIKNVIDDINKNTNKQKKVNIAFAGLTSIINKTFVSIVKNTSKNFSVESNCTLCGVCAKVCPTKNITISDSISFGNNCISCFGCTHNCPSNSIRFKKEKSKVRYRHKDISLKEIIDANNLN